MKYIYKLKMVNDSLNIDKFPIVEESEDRYIVKLNSGIRCSKYKRNLNKTSSYVTEENAIYTDDLEKGKKEFKRALSEEINYYEEVLKNSYKLFKKI